ncbi:unnamed protein product [Rotaria socialis]|uniref:Uncharacterized protein n=3 Tax=Rotaria socialis TaxID=392032 RepID=A0A820Y7P5_9BILA|nr:unnamed protein product [Rotaria socialis]
MTDFYEILEIEKTATDDEVKKAYRRLALKWHPDKNLSNKKQAEEKFKLISEAYEVISDKEKRRKYDLLGRAGLSNNHSNNSHSSNGGYSRFSEDFLNRTFHFHNPFDIFEQFMSHFGGMDDDFGFGRNPFADFHHPHSRFGNYSSSSSSRRDPHRHQMALFDSMFSPMRMSLFDRDSFGHDLSGNHVGSITSVNFSFGSGNARPISKKTTKSTKIVNGRRVVTTRVEENDQTTETIEEDGRLTSRKGNMNNTNTNQLVHGLKLENLSSSTELSAEKVQDLQAAFSLMDSQSKGYVCPNDIIRIAEAADMKFAENEAQLLVGSADEDHSGGIDMREFISIMTTSVNPQDLEEELRQTFQTFDKDGSGTINANELKRFVRLWDNELTEDEPVFSFFAICLKKIKKLNTY